LDDYFPGQPTTLIFGASADKDISGMFAELLPRIRKVIVTQASHPRAAETSELAKLCREYGLQVEELPNVSDALKHAIQNVKIEEVILAAGSIFVAGEILSAWEEISN
jgi:dihydrofolate synthase/folylpolyglutamate synthase